MTGDSVERGQIGATLGRIREAAGLSQAALAKKLPMSAPTISRIEGGDVEISGQELDSFLTAIGTEEAKEFRSSLAQNWSHIQRPPFHHPNRGALWQAEQLLATTATLKGPDAKAAFVKQVEFYENEIRRSAGFLRDLTHDLAFVGSIAVGKSTTICSLADLRLPEEKAFAQRMVLEAGGGGTTICEVRIKRGPQYGLIIEPRSDHAVRQDVADFCEYLVRTFRTSASQPVEGESVVGVSRELERALRNMSDLAATSPKDKSGKRVRHDPARDLVQQHPDVNDLTIAILARMKLQRRTARTVWYPTASSDSPLRWLQTAFAAINNGRHLEFTVPDRIEVVVPTPVLAHPHFDIQIIDTRGINQTAQRADIECHFDNPRTITVLCTKFLDAPEQAVQALLERARASGAVGVAAKTVLLALPRPGEAVSVKDDSGHTITEDEEGYEVKRAQVDLALSSLGLAAMPVCFFNAMYDDFRPVRDIVLSRIDDVRGVQVARLNELAATVDRLEQNKEREEAQAVLDDTMRRVSVWLEKNAELGTLSSDVHKQLITAIRSAHPRSLWASARRRGSWSNLDYYYQLGFGARAVAAKHAKKRVEDLKTIIQNLVDDDELASAHDFLKQLALRVESETDEFLQRIQIAGKEAFTQELENDSEYWQWCENRWVQGSGYRDDVASRSDDWFEDAKREVERELIVRLISEGWKDLIGRVRQLINEVSAGEELA